jgi:hypothetical protein
MEVPFSIHLAWQFPWLIFHWNFSSTKICRFSSGIVPPPHGRRPRSHDAASTDGKGRRGGDPLVGQSLWRPAAARGAGAPRFLPPSLSHCRRRGPGPPWRVLLMSLWEIPLAAAGPDKRKDASLGGHLPRVLHPRHTRYISRKTWLVLCSLSCVCSSPILGSD